MVLPSPAAPDAVPSRRWLDRLKAVLQLGREEGVLSLVRGGPERLGDVVRAMIEITPDADVLVRADALASLPPRSTVLLWLREEDFEWLNAARPVVRGHRIVLFGDAKMTLALEQQAFDFFDWISHRIEAPAGPPAFAVRRLRAAACARAPWIVWRSGDLESSFAAAFPGRELSRVSAAQPYGDLVEALRPLPRRWVAVTDVREHIHLQRARWAAAEAGRLGRSLIVEPKAEVTDVEEVRASLASIQEAAELFSRLGMPQGARIAALLDLDPEALEALATTAKAGETEASVLALSGRRAPARLSIPALAARRLPAWSERVRAAMAYGDDIVALRWVRAWHSATRGAIAPTALLVRILSYASQLEEAAEHLATIERRRGGGLDGFRAEMACAVFSAAVHDPRASIQHADQALRLPAAEEADETDIEELFATKVVGLCSLGSLQEARLVLDVWKERPAATSPSIAHSVAEATWAMASGDFASAARLLESIAGPAGPFRDHETFPVRQKLAQSWMELGRFADAEQLLRGEISRAKELGQPLRALLHEHGRALMGLGRYFEAEQQLQRALAQRSRFDQDPATEVELARCLTAQGRLEESEGWIDQAAALLRARGLRKSLRYAGALHEKARIRALLGHPDEAVTILREVLDQERQLLGGEHPTLLFTLSALGHALVQNRCARAAEPYLRRAQKLAENAGNQVALAVVLGNLAIAEADRRLPQAVHTARKALKAWSNSGVRPATGVLATLTQISTGVETGPIERVPEGALWTTFDIARWK